MVTPLEIEEKEFSKSLRGYNEAEVDEFLDLIILDLQALNQELDQLRAENASLKKENAEHKESQVSVMNTLDQAKKLMRDISESAEKRADIIIRNAKLDAEMIVNDAKKSVYKYTGEGGDLRGRVSYFKERYIELLKEELDSLEGKTDDFLAEFDEEFMPVAIAEELPDTEDVAIEEHESFETVEEIHESLNLEPTPEELFAELEKEVTTGAEEAAATKETVAISSEDIRKLLEKTEDN